MAALAALAVHAKVLDFEHRLPVDVDASWQSEEIDDVAEKAAREATVGVLVLDELVGREAGRDEMEVEAHHVPDPEDVDNREHRRAQETRVEVHDAPEQLHETAAPHNVRLREHI